MKKYAVTGYCYAINKFIIMIYTTLLVDDILFCFRFHSVDLFCLPLYFIVLVIASVFFLNLARVF